MDTVSETVPGAEFRAAWEEASTRALFAHATDMGRGDWHDPRLADVGFDGIATVCVFAWEERAKESSRFNLDKIKEYVAKHGGQ